MSFGACEAASTDQANFFAHQEYIAGGDYDYVINGNMISGFALMAWPVDYARTGVKTFLVSHAGIIYEKDLGPDTESMVAKIKSFNPDKSWDIVPD